MQIEEALEDAGLVHIRTRKGFSVDSQFTVYPMFALTERCQRNVEKRLFVDSLCL